MKLAYQWHGRLGWLLAPLLAISALTGAVQVWLQPLPVAQESPPAVQAWARTVDQGLADLARRDPTVKIEYVNLPREADAPVSVRLLGSASIGPAWVDFDAVHGTAGAVRPDSSNARALLYTLHERLLLGEAGVWVLRASALCALVAIVMGLRVWWRVRRVPPRTPWRRVHRLIGPVAVLPLAMMLVTGFMLRSPEWTSAAFSAWAGQAAAAPKPAAAKPAAPGASAAQAATLGQALAIAAEALPQARPIRIYPAKDGVVRVRMRGDEWHPLGLNNVFVNTADASVKRMVRAADQPLSVRYLNVVYPLHIGSVPGAPGVAAALVWRGLWTLLALSLLGLALTGAVQRLQAKSKSTTTIRRQTQCNPSQPQ
ncbi:MAG TPA: PepSY-associated TM helix domain-containing protein [Burkholderiaceae bacterium]|nr:PepSY-associated TM helix domain-containing protein [Burkholderiaceae bacterium]